MNNMQIFYSEIQQEKLHLSLFKDVENFNTSQLNPTLTEEKVILPSAEGFLCESFKFFFLTV